MVNRNIFFTGVLLLGFMAFPVMAEDDKKVLIFGVHPYLPSTILLERFTPLTEYLSAKLGNPIRIRVATSYQDHIDAIQSGKVDFAYIGPASYVKLTTKNNNYELLGRLSFSGKNTFRGAIILRKDSPINQLAQIQGKKFAFGDPNSTLSSQVPQRLLAEAGVKLTDLKTFSHLKNHHNVALAVLLGKYDAGGVKEEVFHQYEHRGLKVLQWTLEVPSHPFIATAILSKQQIKDLRNLLQNLHLQNSSNINGKNILQKIKKGTTAIIPANIEEYAKLRKLLSEQSPISQR